MYLAVPSPGEGAALAIAGIIYDALSTQDSKNTLRDQAKSDSTDTTITKPQIETAPQFEWYYDCLLYTSPSPRDS